MAEADHDRRALRHVKSGLDAEAVASQPQEWRHDLFTPQRDGQR